MYNDDTDMLFPSRVIPTLRDLRGDGWANLIDEVEDQPPDALDHLGFVLMMIKLGGCTSCHAEFLPGNARLLVMRSTNHPAVPRGGQGVAKQIYCCPGGDGGLSQSAAGCITEVARGSALFANSSHFLAFQSDHPPTVLRFVNSRDCP